MVAGHQVGRQASGGDVGANGSLSLLSVDVGGGVGVNPPSQPLLGIPLSLRVRAALGYSY